MDVTKSQFDEVIAICRKLFSYKLSDYGAAWRILRGESVTDQILIKAKRIRSIEIKKESKIDEDIFSEFIAIVNYGVIGLIQLELGFAENVDITEEQALKLYDKHFTISKELMYAKNHDYDEAWRLKRGSSYTDLILVKLNRTNEF